MHTITSVFGLVFAVTANRTQERFRLIALRKNIATIAAAVFMLLGDSRFGRAQYDLDSALAAALKQAGFTRNIQATLEGRLGRKIDKKLANLGRLLWFDNEGLAAFG
jgi:cytochrome c peroxidase